MYFDHTEQDIMPRGQATIRVALKHAGAEPDESWRIAEEKEHPDLVLEIALTSGGIDKLEAYRRFDIPEVWIWRQNRLEIFVITNSGAYEASPRSRLLPALDVALLEHCVSIRSWQQARQTFRRVLKAR